MLSILLLFINPFKPNGAHSQMLTDLVTQNIPIFGICFGHQKPHSTSSQDIFIHQFFVEMIVFMVELC